MDRDVPIAISRVSYRAGTARSTLWNSGNLLLDGIITSTQEESEEAGQGEQYDIAQCGAARRAQGGEGWVQGGEVDASAVDVQLPPARLGCEDRESNQHTCRGDKSNRHEQTKEQSDAERNFHPRQQMGNGQSQPIWQDDLVRVDGGQGLQGRAELGNARREKKEAEKNPDNKNGCPGH